MHAARWEEHSPPVRSVDISSLFNYFSQKSASSSTFVRRSNHGAVSELNVNIKMGFYIIH